MHCWELQSTVAILSLCYLLAYHQKLECQQNGLSSYCLLFMQDNGHNENYIRFFQEHSSLTLCHSGQTKYVASGQKVTWQRGRDQSSLNLIQELRVCYQNMALFDLQYFHRIKPVNVSRFAIRIVEVTCAHSQLFQACAQLERGSPFCVRFRHVIV